MAVPFTSSPAQTFRRQAHPTIRDGQSFIHYLFLGPFEHDGEVVRFAKGPCDSVYRPVVRRPIELEAIKDVLREVKGAAVEDLAFPDDWMTWLDAGYLVCDKYTRNREVIDFVSRLVERTRCDIYDVSAHCDITLHGWLAVTQPCTPGAVVATPARRNLRA
jgi:hypothetical protein